MTVRPDLLTALATALSDRAPIDWATAESTGCSDAEREQIRNLRLVSRLADAHGTASLAWDQPGLHESLLHPSAANAADADAAPVRWGPLQVVEKIGRGRFGDVYRAWDPRLDRDVALKLLRLRDARGDELESHVIEEGRLLAKVRHPNVVTVYGAEKIDNRVGVWMELVRGRTLEQELTARGPLPPAEVAAIAQDICGALAAVHRAGLLHRDIKAQNVMRDDDGRLVLMDFGTGLELEAASPTELAGTPLYLAPEVLAGGPATPQSDLYSVGVLLYHLAMGGFPVDGRTLSDIRSAHSSQTAPAMPAAASLPSGLGRVIRRSLDPDPGARFSSAIEMGAALAMRSSRRRIAALAAAAIVAAAAVSVWHFAKPQDVPASGAVAVEQIWSGANVDLSGSISPDGRYLAFADWSTEGNVAIRDLKTGTVRLLTEDATSTGASGQSIIFSRDGRFVAYTWHSDPTTVMVAAVDGTSRRALPVPEWEIALPGAWSPDGALLAVLAIDRRDRTNSLRVVSAASGQPAMSRQVPAGARIGGFSQNGQWLLYSVGIPAAALEHGIFALSLDGRQLRPLVQSASRDTDAVWTPDGQSIVFLSNRTGTIDLWRLEVTDGAAIGEPTLLRRNMGQVINLGFDSDRSFFYGTTNAQFDTYSVPIDPSTLQPIGIARRISEQLIGASVGASWSPDGTRMILARAEDSATRLVVRSADGAERPLPTTLSTNVVRRGVEWFPDGRSILALDREGTHALFRRIDVDSGAAKTAFEAPARTHVDFTLSRDGARVYYSRLDPVDGLQAQGRLVLYERTLASGTTRTLFEMRSDGIGFFGLCRSPDGRQLGFMANGEHERLVMTLPIPEGGTPRVIYRGRYDHPRPMALAWSADGRRLIFTAAEGKGERLHALPVEGGKPYPLKLEAPSFRSLAVSPDGRQIAFFSRKTANEVWRITNLLVSPAEPNVAVAATAAPAAPAPAAPPRAVGPPSGPRNELWKLQLPPPRADGRGRD